VRIGESREPTEVDECKRPFYPHDSSLAGGRP
jgi:hypothetical protein